MSWCVALLLGLAVAAASVLYGGLYEPAFRLPSLLLLTVAGGFLSGSAFAGRFRLPGGAAPAAALLLGGYVTLRAFALNSPAGWATISDLAALGVIYLGGAWMASRPKAGSLLIGILLVTAFGQITAGTLGAIPSQPHWPLPWLSETLKSWYAERSGDRLHGFYLNANHLAWFLNSTALFALALTLWARISVTAKVALAWAALALLGSSFQTLSRGGLLAMVVGLLTLAGVSGWLILFRVGRFRGPFLIMLLGGGMGLFLMLQAGLEHLPKYSARFAIAEDEGDYREEIWPVAWRQFQSNPAWGTGPETFKYYARMYRLEPQAKDPVFAHNDWLEFLAEQGTVGLLLVLAMLALHLRAFGRGLKESATSPSFQERPQDTAMAIRIGAFAALAAGATHSFFDFNLHLPANLFLATLCLGWISPRVRASVSPAASPPEIPSWLRVSGAAVGLTLTIALGFLGIRGGQVSLRQLQAENAYSHDRLPETLALTEFTTSRQPDSARAWSLRGRAERDRGNRAFFPEVRTSAYRSAAQAFGKAMKLEPLEASHYLNRCDALLRVGYPQETRSLAAQAIQLDPLQLPGYPYAALAAATEGQGIESRRLYSIALRLPGSQRFTRDQIRRLPAHPPSKKSGN